MRDTSVESVLRCLRALADPCEPPIGVGAFDVLYASEREVVVWYSPARAEHHSGEVAIPTLRLCEAWALLQQGERLDESALAAIGQGLAGGRWLLAVLAQVPGVCVQTDPLALAWDARDPRLAILTPPALPKGRPRKAAS